MGSIHVKDHMIHNSNAISADATLTEAIDALLSHHTMGAPVVDQGKRVVGFISEADCMKHILNTSYYGEESIPVREIMRTDVVSVEPDTSVIELAEIMLSNKPKIYPVVAHGELIGIITRSQILGALRQNSNHSKLEQAS